jgi:arylsulfatase A-like enzyme
MEGGGGGIRGAASRLLIALLGCAVAGCTPDGDALRLRWVHVDIAPVRSPEALRFDLRDRQEQARWRLRSGIARAEPTEEGLALTTSGPDPHLSRPLARPIASLERVVVTTSRPVAGDFVVYPRIRGVEQETWAVRARAVDPERRRHVAVLGTIGWEHGPIEEIRLDPPTETRDPVLAEVALEPTARAVVRRVGDEARTCWPATAVRTLRPIDPGERLSIALRTGPSFGESPEPPSLVVRARHAVSGEVLARGPITEAREDAWQEVDLVLDRETPATSGAVVLEVTDAVSGTDRVACFARPLVLRRNAQARAAAPRPDVLLVSLDTLRADALAHAPFLHALRARGRSFERTWASSNWTLPSHVSLFTSTPVLEHDTPRSSERRPFTESMVPTELPMLAEILADSGYRTGATTGGGYVAPEYGFVRGFERYRVGEDGEDDAFAGHLAFVSDFVQEAGPGPFFLFVHTYAVHDYFRNDVGYHDFVDSVEDAERIRAGSYLEAITGGTASPDYARRLYQGGVARTDHFVEALVGRILDRSGGRPLLVIVTSDHGESFGEHGIWHHGTGLEDEQLRVPFIIWGNFESAPQGGAHSAPSSTLDLAPSLLAFLGVDVPETFRGARDRFATKIGRDRVFPVLASTPHTTRPKGERRLDRAIITGALEYIRTDESDGATSSEVCRTRPADGGEHATANPTLRGCARLAEELTSIYDRLARRVLTVRADRAEVDLRVDPAMRFGVVHAGAPSRRPIVDASGRIRWLPRTADDILFVHGDRAPRRVSDRSTAESLPVEMVTTAGTPTEGAPTSPGGLRLRWRGFAAGAQGHAVTGAQSTELRERLEALGYVHE